MSVAFDRYVPDFLKEAVLNATPENMDFDLYDQVRTIWSAIHYEFEQMIDLDDDGIISNDELCYLIGRLLVITSQWRAARG